MAAPSIPPPAPVFGPSYSSRAWCVANAINPTQLHIKVRGALIEGDAPEHSYVQVGTSAPTYPGVTFVGSATNLPYFQNPNGYYYELYDALVDPRYLGAISDLANSANVSTAPGQVVNIFSGDMLNIASADTGKNVGITGVGAPAPANKFLRVTGVPVAGETLVISQALQSAQTGTGTGAVAYAYMPRNPTSVFVPGTYAIAFSGPLTYSVTDPNSVALGTGYVSTVFPAAAITSIASAANAAPATGYTTTITFASAHGYPAAMTLDIVLAGMTAAGNGTSANGRWFNASCATTTTITFQSQYNPGTTVTVGGGSVQTFPLFSSTGISLLVQQGDVAFVSGDTISVAMVGITGTFGASNSATSIIATASWSASASDVVAWVNANITAGFTGITAALSDTQYNEVLLQTSATGSMANWWTVAYNGAAWTTIPIKHKYFTGGFDYGDAFGTVSYTYNPGGGSGSYTLSGTYSAIQAPGTVNGPDHNSTSSYSAYFVGNLMYVPSSPTTGRVITGTQIFSVGGTNTNLFGRIDRQISGTPGGAGVYVMNVNTFATTAATAGSSASPLTVVQYSPTYLTIGTNNYAALQNAFLMSSYLPSIAVTPKTSAPQTSQYYLQHLGKREVVIRPWGDTGIFGTASPIIWGHKTKVSFVGDAVISALPGFNGATSSLGGQGAVIQVGYSATALTTPLVSELSAQNIRIECGYGWAQRCIWFQSFLNPTVKLQGTSHFVGGRRGVLVGYRDAQAAVNNNNTLYTGDLMFTNQAYAIGYKVDPEEIALHIEQGCSDNIFGRITGFQNFTVIEDNGSANVYSDAHCDSGNSITPFIFTGGSIYKFDRLYGDSFGAVNDFLSTLGLDPPNSYLVTTGNSSIVFGLEVEAFHLGAFNQTFLFNTTTYAAQGVNIGKLTWAGTTPGKINTGPTGGIVTGCTAAQLQQYPTVIVSNVTMNIGTNLVGEYVSLFNPFNSLFGILIGSWPSFVATSSAQLVAGSKNIIGSTGTFYLPPNVSEGQVVEAIFTNAAPTIKTNDGASISFLTATVSGTGTVSGSAATITPGSTAIIYTNQSTAGSTGVAAPQYSNVKWVRTATNGWRQYVGN